MDEHHNSEESIKEKAQIYGKKEFWKGQSFAKDDALRTRDDLLAKNFNVLAGTQTSLAGLSNRILDVPKPEHLKISDY